MLVGYNTNISYKGTVYHVQTEDSGIRNPHIITLLYYKGIILSRKKTSYAEVSSDPDYKEKVKEMMKEQHKAMIRELVAGKHTQEAAEADAKTAEAAEEEAVQLAPATVPEVPVPASDVPLEEPPAPLAEPSPVQEENPVLPVPPKKQISRSLDDILLDYILKEEK